MLHKSTKYLENIPEIVQDVVKEKSVSKLDIEEIMDSVFFVMREEIDSHRAPKVVIPYLGTFRPSLKKVNNKIWEAIIKFRINIWPRKRTVIQIALFWKIRNRLIHEKRGKQTFREWQHKAAYFPWTIFREYNYGKEQKELKTKITKLVLKRQQEGRNRNRGRVSN